MQIIKTHFYQQPWCAAKKMVQFINIKSLEYSSIIVAHHHPYLTNKSLSSRCDEQQSQICEGRRREMRAREYPRVTRTHSTLFNITIKPLDLNNIIMRCVKHIILFAQMLIIRGWYARRMITAQATHTDNNGEKGWSASRGLDGWPVTLRRDLCEARGKAPADHLLQGNAFPQISHNHLRGR